MYRLFACNLLKPNSVTNFFHKNLAYESPTVIRIGLSIFCWRKNRDLPEITDKINKRTG